MSLNRILAKGERCSILPQRIHRERYVLPITTTQTRPSRTEFKLQLLFRRKQIGKVRRRHLQRSKLQQEMGLSSSEIIERYSMAQIRQRCNPEAGLDAICSHKTEEVGQIKFDINSCECLAWRYPWILH